MLRRSTTHLWSSANSRWIEWYDKKGNIRIEGRGGKHPYVIYKSMMRDNAPIDRTLRFKLINECRERVRGYRSEDYSERSDAIPGIKLFKKILQDSKLDPIELQDTNELFFTYLCKTGFLEEASELSKQPNFTYTVKCRITFLSSLCYLHSFNDINKHLTECPIEIYRRLRSDIFTHKVKLQPVHATETSSALFRALLHYAAVLKDFRAALVFFTALRHSIHLTNLQMCPQARISMKEIQSKISFPDWPRLATGSRTVAFSSEKLLEEALKIEPDLSTRVSATSWYALGTSTTDFYIAKHIFMRALDEHSLSYRHFRIHISRCFSNNLPQEASAVMKYAAPKHLNRREQAQDHCDKLWMLYLQHVLKSASECNNVPSLGSVLEHLDTRNIPKNQLERLINEVSRVAQQESRPTPLSETIVRPVSKKASSAEKNNKEGSELDCTSVDRNIQTPKATEGMSIIEGIPQNILIPLHKRKRLTRENNTATPEVITDTTTSDTLLCSTDNDEGEFDLIKSDIRDINNKNSLEDNVDYNREVRPPVVDEKVRTWFRNLRGGGGISKELHHKMDIICGIVETGRGLPDIEDMSPTSGYTKQEVSWERIVSSGNMLDSNRLQDGKPPWNKALSSMVADHKTLFPAFSYSYGGRRHDFLLSVIGNHPWVQFSTLIRKLGDTHQVRSNLWNNAGDGGIATMLQASRVRLVYSMSITVLGGFERILINEVTQSQTLFREAGEEGVCGTWSWKAMRMFEDETDDIIAEYKGTGNLKTYTSYQRFTKRV